MTESEKKKFKASIEDLSDDILLVFFLIDPQQEKTIFSHVESLGRTFLFDSTVLQRDAKQWISKRIQELKIQVEEDAINAIVENSGLTKDNKSINIDILESALQRLILFSPNKKIYDISDVIITAVSYDSFIVWELLNACDEKDYCKCLNLFNKCVLTNQSDISALNEIINILVWKYRMLFSIKEFIANGSSPQDAVSKTCSIRKIGYKGTGLNAITEVLTVQSGPNKGYPSFLWNSFTASQSINSYHNKKSQIESYSRKHLYLILECLQDCLHLSRTCVKENEASLIADVIFMTICSVCDQNLSKKIILSLNKARS